MSLIDIYWAFAETGSICKWFCLLFSVFFHLLLYWLVFILSKVWFFVYVGVVKCHIFVDRDEVESCCSLKIFLSMLSLHWFASILLPGTEVYQFWPLSCLISQPLEIMTAILCVNVDNWLINWSNSCSLIAPMLFPMFNPCCWSYGLWLIVIYNSMDMMFLLVILFLCHLVAWWHINIWIFDTH